MFWSSPDRHWWMRLGAAARRRHARWLASALRRPEAFPRIPTREVNQGGFDAVLATPGGREWAEEWWGRTLENPELDVEP